MSAFSLPPHHIREALEDLAADPRALAAPDLALPRLRWIVDAARATIAADGAASAATRDAGIRLFDAAAGGLLEFARSAIEGDTSLLTAPLAIIGTGRLGMPEAAGNGDGVLFVLGKRAATRMRGGAVARFVANGLAVLGFTVEATTLPLSAATALAARDAGFAETLRAARFIDGRYDLYQRLPGTPAAAGIAAA